MGKRGIIGNGGIMGSGIMGIFGTVVNCKSEDTGFYCSVMKIFNLIMVFIQFFIICYLIYLVYVSYIKPRLFSKKGK
jgi:hypothetical protein